MRWPFLQALAAFYPLNGLQCVGQPSLRGNGFARAADLVQSLVEARDERRLTMPHQRYQKVALLIVDELGFVPFRAHRRRAAVQPPGPAL